MEDFAQYQRLSYKTMEQVRKLLSEVTAANTRDVSLIASGRNDSVEKLGNLIAQQNEGQQALLEEINKNMKELSIWLIQIRGDRHAQKKKIRGWRL